ncbi:MAG: ATP-grasp domain-containing protein [Pseudomonadota bacterium]|nr:ATP-grasp domain-containing protein [Pseudomonadota bacterium]
MLPLLTSCSVPSQVNASASTTWLWSRERYRELLANGIAPRVHNSGHWTIKGPTLFYSTARMTRKIWNTDGKILALDIWRIPQCNIIPSHTIGPGFSSPSSLF